MRRWVGLIEGSSDINGLELNQRDALAVVEEDLLIRANGRSHLMVIEMKRE